MQHHQLIEGRAFGPRGSARLGGADSRLLVAQVDDDDLVAETVHLDEGVVGERAHAGNIGRTRPIVMGWGAN